jgi:hypothetical protein
LTRRIRTARQEFSLYMLEYVIDRSFEKQRLLRGFRALRLAYSSVVIGRIGRPEFRRW